MFLYQFCFKNYTYSTNRSNSKEMEKDFSNFSSSFFWITVKSNLQIKKIFMNHIVLTSFSKKIYYWLYTLLNLINLIIFNFSGVNSSLFALFSQRHMTNSRSWENSFEFFLDLNWEERNRHEKSNISLNCFFSKPSSHFHCFKKKKTNNKKEDCSQFCFWFLY